MKTNEQYHADRTHLNSSALKLILKDPALFYQEWVLGLKEKQDSQALELGSLTHSLILEPEQVHEQYAFFEGLRRAGNAYKEFLEANKGKSICTTTQKAKAEKLVEAWRARVEAVKMMSGGIVEHNLFGKLLDVPVKARCDYINVEQGYIVDVKTTSYPADVDWFKQAIQEFSYDLSAALYTDIAHQTYGKPFDFYFVVISKSDLICDIYRVSSATMLEGRAKMFKAIVTYKKCSESNIWLADNDKVRYDSISYEIVEV